MRRAIAFLGLGLVVVVAGAVIGVVVVRNLYLGFTLTDQPAWIRLPEKLPVTAEATQALDLELAGEIAAEVPFRQQLSVPFRGRYQADVSFTAKTPVSFTVEYEGNLPVDSLAQIEAVVDLNFQQVKQYRDIRITAEIPLRLDLPVHLVVPVEQEIEIAYDGPLVMELDQRVNIPVDTTIDTRFSIDERVSTPILTKFGLDMAFPEVETPILINHADLRIAASSIRFSVTDDPSKPEREDREFPGGTP